jgi:hypothetical protein
MVTRGSVHALYAAALLALACGFDNRLRFAIALPLVLLALAAAAAGVVSRNRHRPGPLPRRVWLLCAAAVALGIVTPATGGPLWYEVLRRGFSAAGVLIVGFVSGGNSRARDRAMACAIGGATLLAAITPFAVPHPQIDVVPWTDAAVRALIGGVHPYTVQAPDVYDGGRDFGFVVQVYPYMPATLLAFAPFVLALGDFRYGLAACVPLTAWLLRRTGERQRSNRQLIDAATLLFVLHPAVPLVVRSGWNEPLLGVIAAGVALACVERQQMTAGIGVFLLPALKQYALAPLLLSIPRIVRRRQWSAMIAGAAVALLTVVPFLIWNRTATLDGMLFQMRAPERPRLTSISLPGLLAMLSSKVQIPIWVSAFTQLAVSAALALAGVATTLPGLFAGSALALLATFVVGWQAFANYYILIGTLLLLAAVTSGPGRTRA